MTDPRRPEAVLGRISGGAPDRSAPRSSVDVLLVQADVDGRTGLARLLRRNAHSVVEASTPAEASEALDGGCAPRLLVVDLEGLSPRGIGELSRLQVRDPGGSAAPLLLLSRGECGSLPGLQPAGVILKPVEAAELVEAVRRLCVRGEP